MAIQENVGRRVLLQGVLAAPLAACAVPALAADTETPIQRLFKEWSDYFAWVNTTEERFTWDGAEWDARFAVLDEIENRMETETAATLDDLALKIAATTSFGAIDVPETRDGEVLAILGLESA